MRRIALALAVGAALVLTTGLPASAQYGGGGGGTTTTSTTTTAPEGEPAQPRTIANVSEDEVAPGDPVTVTVPPVFAPGTEVTINLARAQQGAGGVELGSPDANADGSVSDTVTIPATEDGVYFLYVTGVDSDGNPVVAIVAIVVRSGQATTSAVEGDSFAAAAGPVPASVADAQSNLTPASEAAVVEAVTQSGAGLVLSPEGTLDVTTPQGVQAAGALPTTGGNDISTQVTVGAALLLAGTGLVLLRRRGGFTK